MSMQGFLQQRSVLLTVPGVYTIGNWFDSNGIRREFACRTARISPLKMIIQVPVIGSLGTRVTTHFEDFGKLEGPITDAGEGRLLIDLELDKVRCRQLSRMLTWLEAKQKDDKIADTRLHKRIIPSSPHSILIMADGSCQECFVIDMSRSGASISCDIQPDVGAAVAVGSCVGVVIRHFREGFAVRFAELQDLANLERLVIRTPPSFKCSDMDGKGGDLSKAKLMR